MKKLIFIWKVKKTIKKMVAFLLLLLIIFPANTTTAQVIFDKLNLIPTWTNITNINEDKVNKLNQYLFQNRNLWTSSTLLEANNNNILELDTIYKSPYNLANSWSTNYNFSYWKTIYDWNIAIVDLATTSSGRYTYEAPYYCDLLIWNLAKYVKVWNNICLSSYAQFMEEYSKNQNRTYVNVIKTSEIATADLSKYSIIIFPDITLWKHPEILDDLTWSWIINIKNYANNGGITYFSSKSLILADKMELTKKVVDENTLVKNHANQAKISIENSDFNSQILNFWFYKGSSYTTNNTWSYYDYLLGSYLVNKSNDTSIVPIRYFDIKNDSNYYFQDLATNEDIEFDAQNVIQSFYKPIWKWYVIYNWWSSLFSLQSSSHKLFLNHTLNWVLFSFLRDVYTSVLVSQKSNLDVTDRLIPALEKDITFEYNFDAINVFNKDISNFEANILISTGGIILDSALPSWCILWENNTWSIICKKDLLSAWEKFNINFKLKVFEPNFSKAWFNIMVTSTALKYTNSSNIVVNQNIWNQTIDSVESANIRSSLNLDPGWYYPLPWPWVYVDQVVNAENKWSTESVDTMYTAIVPLISPIFEESDQALLISKMVFAKDYHNSLYNQATKTNYYPLKNTWDCAVSSLVLPERCKDFVIPKLLPENSKYVDNYDEPVFRQGSNDIEAETEINQSFLWSDLWTGSILKQSYLPDADKLFMHASPRRMVRQYPSKRELLFARQDIYFYENPAFPLPKWITDKSQFISIDKYDLGCDKIEGSYGYPNWVIAWKYWNDLICNKLSWIKNKIDYDHLPEWMEKADYLFPIDPKNAIYNYSDIAWFNNEWNYIWVEDESWKKSMSYPFKFVNWSYATFYLPERSSTKWWNIEFDLPQWVNPTQIYILADHIAISKIDRKWQNVKIYFLRWKMPNEQTLKSIVWIALEWVSQDILNVNFKINALKYDLTSPDINTYNFEQEVKANFSNYKFLKMPAVKMKFDLPRRKKISDNQIESLGLNQGQIDTLFTRPTYYKASLVFKKNTLSEITTLINQAKITWTIKDQLLVLFINTKTESFLNKYENMEPFVRFGTYIQELAFHRTIWWIAEDHPISDPWIMADQAMFWNVWNVWINPIPFREYLTTWKFQLIPMATENSRIDYKDIFKREFSSPIRTVLPEAVPLPPPVRDFAMNTTYELYNSWWVLQDTWNNEDELELRQNIKLYNNYPKFFNPTLCVDNKSDTQYYGQCYDGTWTNLTWYNWETEYKLQDNILDTADFYWTNKVKLFNSKAEYTAFIDWLKELLTASWLINFVVKTLNKAQDKKWNTYLANWEKIDDKARNYSPEVEKYFPKDYIKNNMWNLTQYDYDDNVYSKWYPYHMDNQLPNPSALDFWNPARELPHNIVVVPTFKWIGYNLKYFEENLWYTAYEVNNNWKIESNITPYTSWKYPDKKGWWSENLQNKDDTLLAGQDNVNQIPYLYKWNWDYLKSDLITSSDFTKQKTNNIYSCLFNPGLLNDKYDKFQYKANVLLNNIIPIIPWIQKENENSNFLNSYNCNSNTVYDNSNLNKVNNIVETESAYWSYFWANLRWWAKESLNMINRLTPMNWVNFEWDLKIVEWWRFVYWNPAFWPNAFQIVDNNVTVIKSVKSDITVDKELFPYNLKNYKTDAYLIYTVKDPAEIEVDAKWKEAPRKWKNEVYIDSRWGWNFSSSVYVGSSYNWAANKSLLDPGDKTLVRLDLYNNSWYDWDMLWQGEIVNNNWQYITHISWWIDFDIEWQAFLNWTDIMSKVARNVLHPKKFNFLNITIPDEIKDYVTIKPSDANIMTPWTFFDFDFVNVTTIRDWFKGSYFLDILVNSNIPDNLRAKVYEVKVSLNPEYFNHIPWVSGKDPVNWPNTLKIPEIKFAIADSENSAYYISWQSSNISLDVNYNSWFTLDKAYEISEEWLNEFRLAIWDGTNKHRRLRETFENMTASWYAIRQMNTWNIEDIDWVKKVNIDFNSSWIQKFPYVNNSWKIVPKTYILVHLIKDSLDDWEVMVEKSSKINFLNNSSILKTKENTTVIKWYAQGPKLDISYNSSLVWNNPWDKLEIQKLTQGENTVQVKLFLKNTGTDVAFDPTIKVQVASWVQINSDFTTWATINWNEIIINKFFSETWSVLEWEAVGPGITNYFPIYLTYSWSYSDMPVTLVNSANYEFTPFDKALPALTWTYSNWFTLDFVKTDVNYSKWINDNLSVVLSWNTTGIYWDLVENSYKLFAKSTNTWSEVLTKNLELDPTINHILTAISYFKTKSWDFKEISKKDIIIPKEDVFISIDSSNIVNGKDIILNLKTNKYWKYNWNFVVTSSLWDYETGSILSSDSWSMIFNILNVDVSHNTDIWVKLYESWTLLYSINKQIIWEWIKLFNLKSSRINDSNIRLTFQTNRVLNNCYKIKKNWLTITDKCKNIWWQNNEFIDEQTDVFKDYVYEVVVYNKTTDEVVIASTVVYTSPEMNTSAIPIKIIETDEVSWDIVFSKSKDLIQTFIVENTPIRFLVKLKTNWKSNFKQVSSGSIIEVTYANDEIVYATADWDKTINQPEIINNSDYKLVQVWDQSGSLLFDTINIITINEVWEKPSMIKMEHNSIITELPECGVKYIDTCFIYDTNKVKIYTKKFSKFYIYNKKPAVTSSSWWYWQWLLMDTCPAWDNSPSYYDHTCETKNIINTIFSTWNIVKNKEKTLLNKNVNNQKIFKAKYNNFEILYIKWYNLSEKTFSIILKILNDKKINNTDKNRYISIVNDYLLAKYNYTIASSKTNKLRNKVIRQEILYKKILKIINK